MAAQVVPFLRRFQPIRDWTQRELSEFYRVESALIQTGLQLETDRGLTDEGDPWFVFCRADNGEVFIHFARVDGRYIAVGAALEQVVQGKDFPALVQEMLTAQAWVMAKARSGGNVFLHPAALLIALVGAAFFHSGEAKAAETGDHGRTDLRRHVLPLLIRDSDAAPPSALGAGETSTILSSVLIGLNGLSAPLAPLPVASSQRPADSLVFMAPPPASASPSLGLAAAPPRPASVDLALSHTLFDPAVEQATAGPHFALETAPAPSVVADQPVVESMAPSGGLAAESAHPDLGAVLAVSSVVLVETSATDAAEIVQASSVLSTLLAPGLAPITPPAVLADLIDQGAHVTVTAPPTGPAGPLSGPAEGSPGSGADAGTGTGAGVGSGSGTGTGTDVATGLPTHSFILADAQNDALITAAVAHFSTEAGFLEVASSGREIILYDELVLKAPPPGSILESVTFDFPDGSSISLVGTSVELNNLHLHA